MSTGRGKMGILVGGGPAPGINGVISAATIEAVMNGVEVVGIYDGFKWLCRGDASHVTNLDIRNVSRIHFDGGSILRIARDNPTKSEETMAQVEKTIKEMGINYLVTIGGDDTAFSASQVAARMEGNLRVVHVPKTIDNDLPLPGNMPTFGFETARHVGVGIVHNLMVDARTTGRWYLVVAMGRKAGHLALGIGKAAGATLALIAEEFPQEKLTLDEVCDVMEAAMLKRQVGGLRDGVALVAEGIGEKIDPEELKDIPGVEVEYDPHGHLELREIPLARVLKQRLEDRFEARGEKCTIVDINLGYELRCADPIPFDCEYVRALGWGAVKYLMSPNYAGGAMVCLEGGNIRPLPFGDMLDPETGRTQVRLVDVASESYQVALEYMIRLKQDDLEDEEFLASLGKEVGMTPEEFRARFSQAAADSLSQPPLS